MNKTTEALKRVEVWVESLTGLHTDVRQEQGEILAAIREVLAEPVCEHRIADARNEFVRDGYICIKCGALFRAAFHAEPVKQEPVAWVNAERNTITWEKIYPNMEPLYAAPVSAKREWVELTEDEIMDLVRDECVDMRWPSTPLFIARAVIAADREKNK